MGASFGLFPKNGVATVLLHKGLRGLPLTEEDRIDIDMQPRSIQKADELNGIQKT